MNQQPDTHFLPKQQPELSIDFKSTEEALGRGESLTAFPPIFTRAAGTERNWDRLAQPPGAEREAVRTVV